MAKDSLAMRPLRPAHVAPTQIVLRQIAETGKTHERVIELGEIRRQLSVNGVPRVLSRFLDDPEAPLVEPAVDLDIEKSAEQKHDLITPCWRAVGERHRVRVALLIQE